MCFMVWSTSADPYGEVSEWQANHLNRVSPRISVVQLAETRGASPRSESAGFDAVRGA